MSNGGDWTAEVRPLAPVPLPVFVMFVSRDGPPEARRVFLLVVTDTPGSNPFREWERRKK